MPEPLPTPRTTFTVTIKGVPARVICGARLPRWLGVEGTTLGSTILLRGAPADVTASLLAHEFCHVLQWRVGAWAFLTQYVWGFLRHGYGLGHPLERNAYDYALAYYGDFVSFVEMMQSVPALRSA